MKRFIFFLIFTTYSFTAIANAEIKATDSWKKYAQDAFINTDATILFTLERIIKSPSEDDMPGWVTVKKIGKIKKIFGSKQLLNEGRFEYITAIEIEPKIDTSQLPEDYIVNLCFEKDYWTDAGFGTFNQATPDLSVAVEEISQMKKLSRKVQDSWCQK